MSYLVKNKLNLFLTLLLLALSVGSASAEIGIDDLRGEDKARFDRFRDLLQNGAPAEFFSYMKEYEANLKSKGYMMLYFKAINNEGFYALRHNMVYKAMEAAERLDAELRSHGANRYFYLATGLMGDIYNVSHNRVKAEKYFIQALKEVGGNDPKFTMRTYQSLAEMLSLKDSQKALDWMRKSIELAEKTDNTEYYSLSLAMTAYIYFLDGNALEFFHYYDEYQDLSREGKPGFSHRYDKILEVAKMAFDREYVQARKRLNDSATVYVDSSLVAVRLYTFERNIDGAFSSMKRRYLEMDSVYSLAQDANFDEMATERALMRAQAEADAGKRRIRTLTNWLMALVVGFLFVYIMGRRRLMRKIWARNRELKEALSKAEESDLMKMAFIRSMSHEVRTPLNAVAGFSQLLCTPDYELSDAEKLDMRQRIEQNVDQITTIVNEMLELSKSESESTVSEKDKTDVRCNDLVRSVINEVRGKQNTGVDLRFSSDVEEKFTIRTNAYRLKSALSHLMDNAVKFTEQGFVELRFENHPHQVAFSVTDTGIGIKAEDRERIFDTFSKVDEFKAGVGIGLPICRNLVKSLGGSVRLDEDYTEGARFIIMLPK